MLSDEHKEGVFENEEQGLSDIISILIYRKIIININIIAMFFIIDSNSTIVFSVL